MSTPTAPTTPLADTAADLDQRAAAAQFLGDGYSAFTGDWRQTLRQATADWTTAPAPTASANASAQQSMTADTVFADGLLFRTNNGPDSTQFYFLGHLTPEQITTQYYEQNPEHRTEDPHAIDPTSIRHTWQTFTAHASDCFLTTGKTEDGEPDLDDLDPDEDSTLCDCDTTNNWELGTGYEYRHPHPAESGQDGALAITWVNIPPTA